MPCLQNISLACRGGFFRALIVTGAHSNSQSQDIFSHLSGQFSPLFDQINTSSNPFVRKYLRTFSVAYYVYEHCVLEGEILYSPPPHPAPHGC